MRQAFHFWHNEACGPNYLDEAGLDFSDTTAVLFILDEDVLYDEKHDRVNGEDLMQKFLDRFVL